MILFDQKCTKLATHSSMARLNVVKQSQDTTLAHSIGTITTHDWGLGYGQHPHLLV